MQERKSGAGRPKGTKTFDPLPAEAFGAAVRAVRLANGESQEDVCGKAGVERSHWGKIENGRHMPNLALILRIADALGCSAAELVAETEKRIRQFQADDSSGSRP